MNKRTSLLIRDIWLLILRLGASGAMLTHGIPKILSSANGNFNFPDPLNIGEAPTLILTIIAEFVCSILVALGIATRLASIPIVITMLIAIFFVHRHEPFASMELAWIYLLLFGSIAVFGGGNLSLGKWVNGK